jgi:hypothetical protein
VLPSCFAFFALFLAFLHFACLSRNCHTSDFNWDGGYFMPLPLFRDSATPIVNASRSSSGLVTAARSSALMHKVNSDFDSQLAFNSAPALAYGLAITVFGLGVLITALTGLMGSNVLMIEILGGALAFVGGSLLVMRLGVTIDRKLRRVIKWRSFLIKQPSNVYNLSAFDFLTISKEGRGQRTRFDICLSDSNSNFTVASFPVEPEARQFANEVANFLNLRVVDSASGEWGAVQ